jgi:hypothetical protein
VANWATLYRQVSRLPVIPPGTDPRADWFKCERYRARLPKTDCANRHRLSKQRTGDGASYQAVQYGGCAHCNVGAAHAAGLPTPAFDAPTPAIRRTTSMDDIVTAPNGTNGHALTQFSERTCARCKASFQPKTARERLCSGCAAQLYQRRSAGKPAPAKAAPAKAANKRNGKPLRPVKVAKVPPAEVVTSSAGKTWEPKPIGAPSGHGALRPSQIATATELLELAGYKVQTVHTPAGEFLRVL